VSAILSFLGGNAFRMLWGEVSSYVTRRQEHKYELERQVAQERAAASAHERNLASMRLQSELGIKEVVVRSEAATEAGELEAWVATVKATTTPTGVAWVDAWNASIRPGFATLAGVAMICEIVVAGFVLSEWHMNVLSAAVGIFLADRQLTKRGK